MERNQRQWNTDSVDDQRDRVYKRWRMERRVGAVMDIDQFEYDPTTHEPVAIIELSKAEDPIRNPGAYLAQTLKNRLPQMLPVLALAKRIGIPAYFVIFEDSFEHLWVLDLTFIFGPQEAPWNKVSPQQWDTHIRRLHQKKPSHFISTA